MADNVIVRVPEQQFIKGEDGYSPEVTIENIDHGHSVAITDRDHPEGQSFNVLDGDSAYEQAVAGGYTGTEAQFNEELASFKELSDEMKEVAPFYAEYGVTTKAEIEAAINNKRQIYLNRGGGLGGVVAPYTGTFLYADIWGEGTGYRFALTNGNFQYVYELKSEWTHSIYDLTAPAQRAETAAAQALTRMNSADASAQAAAGSAGDASTAATTATTKAGEASDSATAADGSAKDSEAYAIGKRGGTDVGSADPAYHNNAKYYAQQASGSATAASGSATAAASSATAAGNAQTAAETAQGAAEDAQEAAEAVLASIPADYTELTEDVDDLKSAINDPSTGLDTKAPAIIDTASGAIASFEDGADGMPLKSLTVNIEPVQSGSGDPSPTNIRPISGWTGCNIVATKNIFDIDNATWVHGYLIAADGTITANSRYKYCSNYTPIIGGRKITVSCTRTSTQAAFGTPISFYDDQKTFLSRISTFSTNGVGGYVQVTIDVPEDAAFFRLNCYDVTTPVSDFQIEYGDTATDFSPFSSFDVTFPSEAGTVYGGTLDVTNKKLTVDRAIAILNGSENWQMHSTYQYGFYYDNAIPGAASGMNENDARFGCNKYKVSESIINSSGLPNKENATVFNQSNIADWYKRAWVKDTSYTGDLAGFKASLAANNLQIVYPLSTPIVYDLSDISDVLTLLGTNNIWADCGPVSVEYPADTKLYIERINAPTDEDMIADTQIDSGKYFLIGNTLYLSTTVIPAGDTIIPGTNCTKTNLAAALNALNT